MTTHYPTLRPPLLRWLPARCGCGARRFDRCPDAVADAQAGHGAPRGRNYPPGLLNPPLTAEQLDTIRKGHW